MHCSLFIRRIDDGGMLEGCSEVREKHAAMRERSKELSSSCRQTIRQDAISSREKVGSEFMRII